MLRSWDTISACRKKYQSFLARNNIISAGSNIMGKWKQRIHLGKYDNSPGKRQWEAGVGHQWTKKEDKKENSKRTESQK